ncbi:hypothetical protein [Lysobacter soli]|uniref:hypothetical protein n=1 Tax=Lysobacter soli TaxID=453783 RepID=UPI00240EA7A6|nr:hypothetical protein [Lysobacter soli]MDG2517808.1 hypothetical protein [Lysobacter soli]
MTDGYGADVLFSAAARSLPHRVVAAAIDQTGLLAELGLRAEASVTLGKELPAFDRRTLFEAIRQCFRTPGAAVSVSDAEGGTWQVECTSPESSEVVLRSDSKRLSTSNFWMLNGDNAARLRALNAVVRELNLDDAARSKLDADLQSDASDELASSIHLVLSQAPVALIGRLRVSVLGGQLVRDECAPKEFAYYERLIGPVPETHAFTDYLTTILPAHIDRLLAWDETEGTRLVLTMCLHTSFTRTLSDRVRDPRAVRSGLEWALENGTANAKIAAIELGLYKLSEIDGVEPVVARLVEQVLADDASTSESMFEASSLLARLVLGDIALTRTLHSAPPFWRRLAGMAQAALIEREVRQANRSIKLPEEWIALDASDYFTLQTLVELRQEPRWLPDFMQRQQAKHEGLGRIFGVATAYQEAIASVELRQLLFDKDGALRKQMDFFHPFLPGPLEGNATPSMVLPAEVEESLSRDLEGGSPSAYAFARLVNGALLFKLSSRHADLAAELLRKAKYRVHGDSDEAQIFPLISGLAIVASSARSISLAEEVRILSRVSRRTDPAPFAPEDELRVALIASASRESIDDWSAFLGQWITEIAFEAKTKEAAVGLLPQLRRLAYIEPALAPQFARAIAALISLQRGR